MENSKRGFTLIELLVVIAVIGILASVVMASLNSARTKARDSKRLSEFKGVSTALQLYYDTHNTYPANKAPYTTEDDNFINMTQILVNEGYLGAVPTAPSADGPYRYYNYGPGNALGALVVTQLETVSPTTVGPYGSCRPVDVTTNWCSSVAATNYYCLCHLY